MQIDRIELIQEARSLLKDWGKTILPWLMVMLMVSWFILGWLNAITFYIAGTLIDVAIVAPFAFGAIFIMLLDFVRTKELKFSKVWCAFSRPFYFKRIVLGVILQIYCILWALVFIIPGLIKCASYQLTPYLMIDYQDLSVNELIDVSRMMMRGYKWQWWKLYLSMFGWWVLCIITLGIVSVWLIPYYYTIMALFYTKVKDSYSQETIDKFISVATAWRAVDAMDEGEAAICPSAD